MCEGKQEEEEVLAEVDVHECGAAVAVDSCDSCYCYPSPLPLLFAALAVGRAATLRDNKMQRNRAFREHQHPKIEVKLE